MTISGVVMRKFARRLLGKLSNHEMDWNPTTSVSPSSGRSLKITLMGGCQFEQLLKAMEGSGHEIRHVLMGSLRHTLLPDLADDDLTIINITLRHVLADATAWPEPKSDMAFARFGSAEEAQAILENAKQAIRNFVSKAHQKYPGKTTIFPGLFEPSFNYIGALQNPYDVQSPREFVRRLNAELADQVQLYENFHFLDMNELLDHVGREYLHDDATLHASHASFINDWDVKFDAKRLSAPKRLVSGIVYEKAIKKFAKLFLARIEVIHKILHQDDQVKLIICDLDDTLWRGVAAEEDDFSDDERIEGWPLGLIEALLFFKARGGLLALCSKNDLAETTVRFDRIFRGAISLSDFVVVRVNWDPKSANISEILKQTNLLARNCLFIDDNVREVAEVTAKHPDLRCLGVDHYNWRRTVLTAAETQVATITDESLKRTALVQATAARLADAEAAAGSREDRLEWLRSLKLRQSIQTVKVGSKSYERAFELINKTNQFNTNGKRWTSSEFRHFFDDGGTCFVSSLADKTIDNGIVGVCLVKGNSIVQVVLSCRVFGLEAENVIAAVAINAILKKHDKAIAGIIDTGRNATCHSYYASVGFDKVGDQFEIANDIDYPSHIAVSQS
jgi:FkbH-like protein